VIIFPRQKEALILFRDNAQDQQNKKESDDGFVRFFENGIKRAKRLEELYKELIWQETLEGTVYYYDKKLVPQTIHSVFIRSTSDLDVFLKEVDKLIEENKNIRKLYIGLCFSSNDVLQRDKEAKRDL